jgi:hypothetical protein
MQLRFAAKVTSEEYIRQQAWREAMLECCPLHPQGGCGVRSHGSYRRKQPDGLRIPRFYCRQGQTTISLLPDFAAARVSGTLADVERAVEQAEVARTLASAARDLRPELNDERSAVRWLRRLVRAVHSALTALVTSLPELFGTAPRIAAVRERLGTKATGRGVLTRLRALGERMLSQLRAPLGFFRPRRGGSDDESELQHRMGPDPGGGGR